MPSLTYPEQGATRSGPLPGGYHHLRHRALVGGPERFTPAVDAVLSWRAHRATGARVDAGADRASLGVPVTVRFGLGPLSLVAPCEVVWVEEGPERGGFGYGTLPGHPECGEESFLVSLEGGQTWFTVTAFSRPDRWFTRAAGPVVPLGQHLYARLVARAVRRLSTR